MTDLNALARLIGDITGPDDDPHAWHHLDGRLITSDEWALLRDATPADWVMAMAMADARVAEARFELDVTDELVALLVPVFTAGMTVGEAVKLLDPVARARAEDLIELKQYVTTL